MVLSRVNSRPHLVLTSCAAAVTTSSCSRPKWRHYGTTLHLNITSLTAILLIVLVYAIDIKVDASAIAPPNFYDDLPARISYFMNDGLTLNCSVLSDTSNRKSSSYGSASGGAPGKSSSNRAYISWYKVKDSGKKVELNQLDERYAFHARGCQLFIKPSFLKKPDDSKGSYFYQAKNGHGVTRSRKCVVTPVSSTISANKIAISSDSASIYKGGTAVLACKIQPEYAHSFYRILRWEIISGGSRKMVTNSTEKYSVVKSIYPSELHIRRMNVKDTRRKYVCVVESTIRQKDTRMVQKKLKRSPQMTVSLNSEVATFVRPYLQISHRHVAITALSGTSVELPCVFASRTKISYTWHYGKMKVYPLTKKEQREWATKYQIVAKDHGNLRITNLDNNDSGVYKCGATAGSQSGTEKAVITLKVKSPLRVKVKPQNQEIDFGKKAQFRCDVLGYPLKRIYWLHNGHEVTTTRNLRIIDKNKTLVINKVDKDSAGVYQCFAETGSPINPTDNAQDSSVLRIDKMPPQLVAQYPAASKDGRSHVMLGTVMRPAKDDSKMPKNVRLRCDFVGSPEPHITWYLDDERIPLSGKVIKLSAAPWKDLHIDMEAAYQRSDGSVDKSVTFGGEYRAVATNDYGKAECRTFVEVDAKMEIRDYRLPLAIEGQTYRLKCYVLGKGTYKGLTISWSKKDKSGQSHSLPNNHRHTMEEEGRLLVIKRLKKKEDDGTYTCTAKNKVDTISKNFVLNVMRMPVINSFVKEHHLSEGLDKVTVTCNIKNQADRPWYAWWTYSEPRPNAPVTVLENSRTKKGVQITYSSKTKISTNKNNRDIPQWVPANTWVMLEIESPEKTKHTGNYTCIIKNGVGESRATATITFKPKIKFKIQPKPKMNVTLHKDLSINCTARGNNPKPIVEWKYFKKNTYISILRLANETKGRIYQAKNGTLVVQRFSRKDPIQYMCYVSLNVSDAEAVSQVVKIVVQHPAQVRRMKDKELKVGDHFNLSCYVDGDGEIEADWLYFQKDTKEFKVLYAPCISPPSYNHQLGRLLPCRSTPPNYDASMSGIFRYLVKPKNERGIIHCLTFPQVKEHHQTLYRCRARNQYNEGNYDKDDVKLTVISRPSPPRMLLASDVKARSIYVTWRKPLKDGNKRINHYDIAVFYLRTVKVQPKKPIKTYKLSATEADIYNKNLTGLHPAYEYLITVSAVNSVNASKVIRVKHRTKEDKPSGKVRDLTANGTSSDKIEITWQRPAEDKLNGLLQQYHVCLLRAGPDSSDDAEIPTADEDWQVGSPRKRCEKIDADPTRLGGLHTFHNLPKFTKYFIRVVARNAKGDSPPAFTYARTLEDVPRRPPTKVTCTGDAHGTSVRLQWNPPNQDDMNGILTGYQIQYFKSNDYEDESSSKVLKISSQTEKVVKNLTQYTNYTFRIYAVNSKGSGPSSSPVTCRTKASRPDPPAEMKVVAVNESCLAVSWRQPKHSNGILTEYELKYRMSYLGSEEDKEVKVPANNTAYYNYKFICGLSAEDYRVAVRALNHAAYSSDYTESKIARPISNAPARTLAFNQSLITTNNVDLLLPCEYVGAPLVSVNWRTKRYSGAEMDRPWLRVPKIQPTQSGEYICHVKNDFGSDHVLYFVQVRVIKATPPNPPKLTSGRQNDHSVEVEWRPTGSAGSHRKDTPISRYYLTYMNTWTKEKRVVAIQPSNRTFFLSNLTCGTLIHFFITAENKIGNSTRSETIIMKTQGSRPVAGNSDHLLGRFQHQATSAYFNLTAVFKPGFGCNPLKYRIFLVPSEADKFTSVTREVDHDSLKDQCCYNMTGLNAGSHYKYRIVALNAFGSENITGRFYTLTHNGKIPTVKKVHGEDSRAIWEKPAVLAGLIFVIVVIVGIILTFVFFWRRRTLEEQLHESEKGPVNPCLNDLKGDEGKQTEPGLRHSFLPRQLQTQTSRTSRSGQMEAPEEGLSDDDGSVDSDGNINPYATFATYETNTIDRHEMPDGGPRELGVVERERDIMRERMRRQPPPKRKRSQYYESSGPKQYENETLAPMGGPGAKRRANSLEDLDSVATYNRGYATGGGGQMGRSFYESKYTDQLTAPYRGGSVISSTTMSSNHDELTQAYEYGRRARYESSLTTDAFNVDDNLDLHTGSGSSETTDPGIRQFTQQPPMPDEQRQATCEVPLFSKTPSTEQRRTSINPSETYEAVDEAYYKRGMIPRNLHHPARQAPLPELPPLSSTTLGRPRISTAGGRHNAPFRARADSDSVYGGPGHVYDSTDSYYSSYTPGTRRVPMGAVGGVQQPLEFPRRPMQGSRYYNGAGAVGGPSERHPLVPGAMPIPARQQLYGAHAMPGADPDESRSLLMNNRRVPVRRGSGPGSSTGGSASGSSSVTVAGPGSRRPSRPTVPGSRGEAVVAGAVGGAVGGPPGPEGPLMAGMLAVPAGDNSDSEAENIYTSQFTVV